MIKTAVVTKVGRLNDPDAGKRGVIEILDEPKMELRDEDVRIKVAYCAICGSDPHTAAGIFGWEAPFGMGHEMSGVITELGKNATKKGLKVCDRVGGNFLRFCGSCYYCKSGLEQFCPYGEDGNRPCFAEEVVWHESQVFKLPESVSLLQGCLMEPISVSVRTLDKAEVKLGHRVLISGGGPIGQIDLQLARLSGAAVIALSEPIAARRELALKYGADYVIDPTTQDLKTEADKITGGWGFDVVIDASGSKYAAAALPEVTAKGGRIVYAAQYPNDYEMPLNLFEYLYEHELTLTGVYASPYVYPRTAEVMSKLDLADLTQKIFPLDQIKEAFDCHLSGKYPKVIVKCNPDLE